MSQLRLHPFSRNIAATDYNPLNKELVVTFKPSGTSYKYFGVPSEVHDKMLESKAVGTSFNALVKYQYQFKKLEPDTEDQQSQQT